MFGRDTDGVTDGFAQRVLFILLIVALSALALKLVGVWLLVFGAIIVAVILRAVADPFIRFIRLPAPLAILLALVLVIAAISAIFYLFGYQIADEVKDLWQKLPEAWAQLQIRLQGTQIGVFLQDQIVKLQQQASALLSMAPRIAQGFFSGLANLLVAVVGGIFVAMRPGSYRDGIVILFPKDQRESVRESLNDAGRALKLWLMAQSFSMVLVGTLTGVGLSLIGVESALALGLISGLAQFIPIVGPIISAGPGLILAGSQGGETFAWALAIYVGVSQLEANVITPTVQQKVATIPTVVTLFAVIAFASLFGALGVLFATPLTVVIYTLVLKLYVGKVLDDPESAAAANPDSKKGAGKGRFGFLKAK